MLISDWCEWNRRYSANQPLIMEFGWVAWRLSYERFNCLCFRGESSTQLISINGLNSLHRKAAVQHQTGSPQASSVLIMIFRCREFAPEHG